MVTCELRGELIVRKMQGKNLSDRRSEQQVYRPQEWGYDGHIGGAERRSMSREGVS